MGRCELGGASSGVDVEQVAQVIRVRRVPEQRLDAENLLKCPQRRAVTVIKLVRIAAALGERRQDDHADRTVAGAGSLVPDDEESPARIEIVGGEDLRHLARKPEIAVAN